MGRTPIPLLAPPLPVPLEVWHTIHDAAVDAGCDPDEACERADDRHWPHDEACPADVRELCSPFRTPRPGGLRPSTPDTGRRVLR